MEGIEHKYIEVNELKLHVAETGSGNSPVVVFLHGFPEIWYSWRRQMMAVAKAGYRAIAPDFRGYGFFLLVKTLELLSFRVLSLVSGFIVMGVPFLPPGPLEFKGLPEGFYVSRFREPVRAEVDFGRLDAKTVVRNIYILFSRSEIPIANENQEIMDIVQPPLPPWFSEEDLSAYGALYENSGFRTALQVPYRSLHEQLDITDPTVHVPSLFIMGEKDYFLKFPGIKDYISSEILRSLVPNMQIVNLAEGTHFVQEQLPDEVNQLVLEFLTKNSKLQ
ncbi:hypothetical protein T459_05675 [Capsicum annuum]|uniref:AB hydrolase-1 domain-containing protein n=1 Tax=Capsicum annuum TaxID=4072 RepID=A0A2G3A8J9_CAPAN|nr:hypothetical protein T459_05675 [Capsicum annuum]